jgi:hypothetical protein
MKIWDSCGSCLGVPYSVKHPSWGFTLRTKTSYITGPINFSCLLLMHFVVNMGIEISEIQNWGC